MKKKALAIALALCMVLAMLPASVFAAPTQQAIPFRADRAVGFHALPKAPVETNGDYRITKSRTGPGTIASNPDSSANAGDEVLLMVNPDPGYTAYVDDHGLNLEFLYIGYNVYLFTMPACNVTLDFYFEPLEGPSYSLDVNAAEDVVWYCMDVVTSAKEGENVILFLEEREHYTFDPETDVTANCEDFYYLGYMEEEERHVYELFMPAHDVTINISTTPQAVRHYIDVEVNNRSWGWASVESDSYARVGETVTFYAEPHYGHKLVSMYTESGAEIMSIGNYLYTFTMPDAEETIYVNFAENINPVSVIVETGIGGTATLDVTEAKETDQVMLHCIPDDGYRVAQITGVDEIFDFGGGYYLFTMPDKPTVIRVLFLRHENPFLDINETRFFYDSVLWAYENGITYGITDTEFAPDTNCTRAHAVTFLWRAAGSPEPETTEHSFLDVKKGSFYEQAVLWAVENGITKGTDATHFSPDLPCSRATIVTLLYRAFGSPSLADTGNPFSDVPAGAWYTDAILWAVREDITKGLGGTTFGVENICNRGQMVTFLHRAYSN